MATKTNPRSTQLDPDLLARARRGFAESQEQLRRLHREGQRLNETTSERLTTRETFLVLASTASLIQADAAIVLCGEDCGLRLRAALELYRASVAPLFLLTGGLNDPPRLLGAQRAGRALNVMGVPATAIMLDNGAMNTREQAVNAVHEAGARGWRRLVLVASAYHQYRALLTFVRALSEAEKWDVVRVSLVPSLAPWCQSPVGRTETRAALLGAELAKIEQYGKHVATYQEGIDYLQYWEGAP